MSSFLADNFRKTDEEQSEISPSQVTFTDFNIGINPGLNGPLLYDYQVGCTETTKIASATAYDLYSEANDDEQAWVANCVDGFENREDEGQSLYSYLYDGDWFMRAIETGYAQHESEVEDNDNERISELESDLETANDEISALEEQYSDLENEKDEVEQEAWNNGREDLISELSQMSPEAIAEYLEEHA